MTVTVLFFARAKDIAGAKQTVVTLPVGATVADLRKSLAAARPSLAPLLGLAGGPGAAISVGQAFAPEGHVLRVSACVRARESARADFFFA